MIQLCHFFDKILHSQRIINLVLFFILRSVFLVTILGLALKRIKTYHLSSSRHDWHRCNPGRFFFRDNPAIKFVTVRHLKTGMVLRILNLFLRGCLYIRWHSKLLDIVWSLAHRDELRIHCVTVRDSLLTSTAMICWRHLVHHFLTRTLLLLTRSQSHQDWSNDKASHNLIRLRYLL